MPVCEYCRPHKSLANENEMHRHISVEHPFRCTLCPDSLDFSSHYIWINHYTRQHGNRCPYCDTIVGEDNISKRTHFKQVHNYHTCTICLYCFEFEEDLIEHYKNPAIEAHLYMCKVCNKSLVNNHEFWFHCFEEHLGDNCCPLCEGELKSELNDKVQWGEHLKRAHNLVPCSECFEVFQNQHECQVHFKDQHRVFCAVCQADFPSENLKNQHTNTNHRFICSRCPKQFFKTVALLDEHLNTVHKIKCSTCSMYFLTKIEFEHHYNEIHRHLCDYCPNSFATQEVLQVHVNLSHKYLCIICDEYLDHSETLRYHYDVLHQVKCDLCAKVCSTDKELRMHYNVAHGVRFGGDDLKCVCSDCHQICGGEKELVAHYKEKHVKQWENWEISPPPAMWRRSTSN